jgi:hypothetical protein
MNELLSEVIAAHGGAERWKELNWISATFSLKGAFFQIKGKAGVIVDTTARADCHRQYIPYTPFSRPGTRSVFEQHRVAIESMDGRQLEQRDRPRAAFAGHNRSTPWDDLHLAYFTGYAMWNYLTTPFMLALPGIQTEEVDPWDEDGERWRRLQAIFPSNVATHSREQTFYFDSGGLLRRLDYHAEVAGSIPVAHYVSEHREVGGIIVPRRRRAMLRKRDGRPDQEKGPTVAIDFVAVEVG